MDNKFLIRKMNDKDIEDALKVENRSFSIPWSRQMFIDELKNPCAIYFVAEISEIIVAYVGMWIIMDEGHITNIAVDPLYRRSKVGSGLMKKIIETATEKQIRGLTLEVRANNTAAISMYKSFGFKVEGRRKAYYSDNGEDALIMWYYNQGDYNQGDGS